MKCSNCSSTFEPAASSITIRCPSCGVVQNGPSPAVMAAPAKPAYPWQYATPYGMLLVHPRETALSATFSITLAREKTETAATLIKNLVDSWHQTNHPDLPPPPSFDPKERPVKCRWTFPNASQMIPLASFRPPLPAAEVFKLIALLKEPLEKLHQFGLGAWDLSPSCLFVDPNMTRVTLVPTIWLAGVTSWSSQQVGSMKFVAPELDRPPEVFPDPVRADVYSLGALAWYLLTGQDRKGKEAQLPSAMAPELAQWDAFVNGCCKSTPKRRFASVAEAVKSLEARPPVWRRIAGALPSLWTRPTGFKPARAAILALLAIIILGIVVWVGVPLVRPKSTLKGFGDTTLRYADRSYEGSQWEELTKGANLPKAWTELIDLAEKVPTREDVGLTRVVGLDEENFWVIAADGSYNTLVLRYKGGHPLPEATPLRGIRKPQARILDNKTLLVAEGLAAPGNYYEVSLEGFGAKNPDAEDKITACKSIFSISPDLYYLTTDYHGIIKMEKGVRTVLQQNENQAEVYKGPVPLPNYYVKDVDFTRNYAEGRAIGVASSRFGNAPLIVVEFKGTFWEERKRLASVKPGKGLRDNWLYSDGTMPRSVMLVGTEGYVYYQDLEGEGRELTLPIRADVKTKRELVSVWGVGPEKFWIMDNYGMVWERKGLNSEWGDPVIKGLFNIDAKFVDAWVSPEGTVIAITKTQIWRLR